MLPIVDTVEETIEDASGQPHVVRTWSRVELPIDDQLLLRDKSEKASAYANLEFALTPDIVWNTNFGYATSYVSGHAQWPGHRDDARPTNWWGINPETGAAHPGMIARLDDPFLPDALRAHMQANGWTQVPMSRHYSHLPMSREIHRREAISFGTDVYATDAEPHELAERVEQAGGREWCEQQSELLLARALHHLRQVKPRARAADELFGLAREVTTARSARARTPAPAVPSQSTAESREDRTPS